MNTAVQTSGGGIRFAKRHPFDYSLTTRFKAVHVLDYLRPQPGDSILDVGCGLGFFLNAMARRGVVGHGMDFSDKSLKLCRDMTSGRLCRGDAQVLPFKDNSFEKIIFTDVLEHVADDSGTLSEIVRIAQDGARIVLVTPCVKGRLASTGWRKLFHDEEGTPEYDERAGYTPDELRLLVEGVGIHIEDMRQTLIFLGEFFLQFTKWVLARKKVHYQTQGDLLDIVDSWSFGFYRRLVFPLFWAVGRLEEKVLGRVLDGHSLIVMGTVNKKCAGLEAKDVKQQLAVC